MFRIGKFAPSQPLAVRVLGRTFAWLIAAAVVGVCLAQPAVARAGTHRALLIGINSYERLISLRGALNDVETVKALLLTRYGFEERNVSVITDRQATRVGILQAFERLVRETGPDDTVYIHYSGHGSQAPDDNGDEEDGLDETICPQDARTAGVKDITDDELDRIVSRLKARSVVLVLDSCHSGTGLRGAISDVRTRSVPPDDRLELYQVATRAVVPLPISERYLLFTGAADYQNALDGPFAGGRFHGLFTYVFSQALGSASPDATPREIMDAIESQLEKVKPRLGGKPMPEPQLEAPGEYLDRPLLAARALPEIRPGTLPEQPRLPYAVVRAQAGDTIRLVGAARLGGQPGSIWAVYSPVEREFPPGGAVARLIVERNVGDDALVGVLEGRSRIADGARAVLSAPPPSDRMPVLLREVPSPLRGQLESGLRQLFGDAIELVAPGKLRAFVIDCEPISGKMWSCSVFDPEGEARLATLRASGESMALEISRVIYRMVVVGSLLALENPASRIQLEMRVRGKAQRPERSAGTRGLVITADTSPHRLHFYTSGSLRTSQNSLQLEIRSSHECYLTLVDVDSEGGVLQIFPNQLSEARGFHPQGRISAGEAVLIPDSLESGNRAGFYIDYAPPAGEDTVRAFCSTQLRDAQLLRERIAPVSGGAGTRSATPADARMTFSQLGRDLSRASTRGLVVTADESGANAAHGSPQTAEADWTAATVTLQIAER